MNSEPIMTRGYRRHRPNQWFRVEGTLGAAFCLMVVTVAWFNNPTSPGRIALLVASWGFIAGAVTLAVRRRAR
jgi:hypothetical protein